MNHIIAQTVPELEAQLGSVTNQRDRIKLLNQIGWILRLDDPERSRLLSEQAYAYATGGEFAAEPFAPGVSGSLRNLAFLNNDIGNYSQSLDESLRALELLKSISDNDPETQSILIDVIANLSWTHRSCGDFGVAMEYASQALELARESDDLRCQARLLNILGNLYAELNQPEDALHAGLRALQYFRELGLVNGASVALNNLSLTYLQLGNGEKALETCRESLRIADEHGVTSVVLTALSTLGEIYLGIGDCANAEIYLMQALRMARERGARYDEFLDLLNLGKLYHRRQENETALATFREALALSQILNDRAGEFQCHQLLAGMYEQQGKFQEALHHFKQFHFLKETVFTENAAKRLAGLQVIHQVETAKRDAEIHYLRTIELKQEIEERKVAQAVLEKLASIDPLTGVLNRREFFILGERQLQRSLQAGEPLTVILFDVDDFKQLNDAYGHGTGDRVLIHITKTAQESLRRDELIGRYGGDEFVILLPKSSGAEGLQIAGRLLETIASRTISTSKGDLSLTLSLGIAELGHADSANLELLLARADQALYAAKRGGRNQAVMYIASHA